MKRYRNEELDRLGDRFVENCIGQILHITFETYITDPERYDTLTDKFFNGCGICLHPTEGPKAVEPAACCN